jgi:A/G-specific adenine glycosylase
MKVERQKLKKFQKEILDFYKKEGRVFAWRATKNPYHIVVSEFMLQQTQVSRVALKYPEFIKIFPTIEDLAQAPLSEVLRVWSGLGYNRRAKMLRLFAVEVMKRHGGKIPKDTNELLDLPGIGQSTAGAVRAFAFDMPSVFIETNIRRVFIHYFAPKKKEVSDKELLPLIEYCAHHVSSPRIWYWALMDYGSHLPKTIVNPNRRSKHYKKQSSFVGSNRQVRGAILRTMLAKKKIPLQHFFEVFPQYEQSRVQMNLDALIKEGIVSYRKGVYTLAT